MADDFRANFDQLLTQAGQRPRLRRCALAYRSRRRRGEDWGGVEQKAEEQPRALQKFTWQLATPDGARGTSELNLLSKLPVRFSPSRWRRSLPAAADRTQGPACHAVKGFFAKLTKQRLKRGVFRLCGRSPRRDQTLRCTNRRNPKPFVWTADRDTIIAAVTRGY
jgi:hypothetical protein